MAGGVEVKPDPFGLRCDLVKSVGFTQPRAYMCRSLREVAGRSRVGCVRARTVQRPVDQQNLDRRTVGIASVTGAKKTAILKRTTRLMGSYQCLVLASKEKRTQPKSSMP